MLGNPWKMESGWAALSAAGQRAHTAGSGPKRLPNEAQPLTASECELRKNVGLSCIMSLWLPGPSGVFILSILSVAVVSQWLYGPYLSALGLTYHNESQRIPGVKSRNFRRISGNTEVKTFMIRYM